MARHRIYSMSMARAYPLHVDQAERSGRTREKVDETIRWLTGYGQDELEA